MVGSSGEPGGVSLVGVMLPSRSLSPSVGMVRPWGKGREGDHVRVM